MNRVRLGVAILLTLVLCSCGTAWLTSELEEVRMWITRLGESEMPFWWNIL